MLCNKKIIFFTVLSCVFSLKLQAMKEEEPQGSPFDPRRPKRTLMLQHNGPSESKAKPALPHRNVHSLTTYDVELWVERAETGDLSSLYHLGWLVEQKEKVNQPLSEHVKCSSLTLEKAHSFYLWQRAKHENVAQSDARIEDSNDASSKKEKNEFISYNVIYEDAPQTESLLNQKPKQKIREKRWKETEDQIIRKKTSLEVPLGSSHLIYCDDLQRENNHEKNSFYTSNITKIINYTGEGIRKWYALPTVPDRGGVQKWYQEKSSW